jgi:hypothetical protein
MPRLIDAVLNVLVTPEQLIRIHSQGANLKEAIDVIVAERAGDPTALGGLLARGSTGSDGALGSLGEVAESFGVDPGKILGGLGSKKEPQTPTTPADSRGKGEVPAYGIGNVKHFGLNGPLGIAVGIAKDPMAREADLTAEMRFMDGDWKLSGLVPRL